MLFTIRAAAAIGSLFFLHVTDHCRLEICVRLLKSYFFLTNVRRGHAFEALDRAFICASFGALLQARSALVHTHESFVIIDDVDAISRSFVLLSELLSSFPEFFGPVIF